MSKCGCVVDIRDDGRLIPLTIVYCPLHAAAPELLEALEQLVRNNEEWNSAVTSVIGRNPKMGSDLYLNQARKVILKAKGARDENAT